MHALWKHYNTAYPQYEKNYPLAYPWNRSGKEDVPRYVLGADGYWYDPCSAETGKALLSCTGDLMCEPRMTNACKYGDTYFFHPLFQYVRDILKSSDFAVANLETLLAESSSYAGEYHRVNRKFHCNGPVCYLDALRYAGFDALVAANNHNCDAGVTGIVETLDALDAYAFPHTGLYRPEDTERVLFVKICGIKIAIVSYASRYNSLDTDNFTQTGIQQLLNYFSKEKIDRETAYARSKGAECILCYIHWGKDYDLVPNEQQMQILSQLKEADIDYIIGSHTHCLQQHSIAQSDAGREIPMMFSMGNFVTNEARELCKHTGILQLLLERDHGKIRIREYMIPCYVYDEFHGGRFCVVPADPMLNTGYWTDKMQQVQEYVRERIGELPDFLPTGCTTLAEICQAMQVPVPDGMAQLPVTKLATQVGTTCRGAVYFSLEEETFYTKKELPKRELTAIIAEQPIEGLPCILVEDVKKAYEAACKVVREHCHKAKTILVAGGEGKTLTRQLIGEVLKTAYAVYTIADGYQIDMAPWQQMHPRHEFLIQELRDDHPLGVEVLARTIHPEICVVTAMTDAIGSIAASMEEGSILLFNACDQALMEAVKEIDTTKLEVIPYTEEFASASLPYLSMTACTSAAYVLGKYLGIEEDRVKQAILQYRLEDCTHNMLQADGVTLVLNLRCKSSDSAKEAIISMGTQSGRKLAVFGITENTQWESLAKAAAEAGAAEVFLIGENVETCTGTVAGVPVTGFQREVGLEQAILEQLQDGDVLLFNGARETNLCITVRRLFGISDGYLPNSEFYTATTPLPL